MKRCVKIIIVAVVVMIISMPVFAMQREDRVNVLGDVQITHPLNGDVVSIAGNIDISEQVNGDVVAVMGNITILEEVNGDVVAVLGTVTLEEGARINGDVVAIGTRGIEKGQGAEIRGEAVSIGIANVKLEGFDMHEFSFSGWDIAFLNFIQTVILLILLVLGLIVTLLASSKIYATSRQIEQQFIKKLVIGLLISIVFIVMLPIISITIIGLPIAVIGFIIVYLIGFSAVCVYIGQKIMELFNGKTNIYGEYIIGAILIGVIHVTFHHVWWLSVTLGIVSIGLGLDAWFGKKKAVNS